MKLEERYYLTFSTTHLVFKAEKVLKREGIKFYLVPIPREISSSCGMAIMLLGYDEPKIRNILAKENIPVEGFQRLSGKKSSLWKVFFGG